MYFKQHELIEKKFSQRASFYKGDFLNAYRIEYTKVPFDHYGDADYRFQYVDDRLRGLTVTFSFKAGELDNFERLFKTLSKEMDQSDIYQRLKPDKNINDDKIIASIRENCKITTKEGAVGYSPIKVKNYSTKTWTLGKKYSFLQTFVTMSTSLTELHTKSQIGQLVTEEYDGGTAEITLFATTSEYVDLLTKESNLVRSYEFLDLEKTEEIPLKFDNSVYKLPVTLNNVIKLDFILDLGASDVSISPDVFLVLYKSGTITDEDFIGTQTYQFADGTTAKSSVFNVKSIQIGNIIIKNVKAAISNSISSPLLLGQSALKKLSNYRIDNARNILVVDSPD
jgi:aspartyl protease family protein